MVDAEARAIKAGGELLRDVRSRMDHARRFEPPPANITGILARGGMG